MGFPFVQMVKNLPAVQETWLQPLGWEDPLEKGKATQLQYSCVENSMDYMSAWGGKELDTTERLSLSLLRETPRNMENAWWILMFTCR